MRAQRQFWTDLCPPFGQNVARKAGIKRYEKKRKNENSGFSDLTKSAVFENEFSHGLVATKEAFIFIFVVDDVAATTTAAA